MTTEIAAPVPPALEAVTGRIISADEGGAVLEVAGRQQRVEYRDVAKALVQVEFGEVH